MTDIPEEILHRIWETRISSTTPLATSDGLPLSVVDHGTPNHDAGPDFLDALLRIGMHTYRGDVEIHGTPEEWYAHGHHTDPHYNRVVLHVVATCPRASPPVRTLSHRTLPLLILDKNFASLRVRPGERTHQGGGQNAVSAIMARLHRSRRPRTLLRRKEWHRIRSRMRCLERRVVQLLGERQGILAEPAAAYEEHFRDIPLPQAVWTRRDLEGAWLWDQILYEGIMEALGYARNTEAFLALARNVPLARLRRVRLNDAESAMALLFGAAGLLLPVREAPEMVSRRYLRGLRKRWNILQETIRVPRLTAADWLFFRLRPANFPTARLAAFIFLLPELFMHRRFSGVKAIVAESGITARERLTLLRRLFRCEPDSYWRHHVHFHGLETARGASIGRERIDAILLNSVLPLIMVHARIVGDARLERNCRQLLSIMPSGHETRIMEEVRRLLAPGGRKRLSALEQQGVIHLYYLFAPSQDQEARMIRT
jgi:hypothetical protein